MSEEKEIFSTMHVDLDSLVDTRLATLIQHGLFDFKDHNKVLKYFKRNIDEFEHISFEDFKELYAKRDVTTLSLSVGTHINHLIRDFCCSTLVLPLSTPWNMKPRICLNIHPYKLDDHNLNIIMRGMIFSLKNIADIQIVSLSNERLTPEYIKDKYSMFVKYDMFSWLDIYDNEKSFESIRLPEIGFIGPALFYKNPKDSKEWKSYMQTGADPFKDLCTILKPIINLVTISASQFSAKVTGVNDKVEKII